MIIIREEQLAAFEPKTDQEITDFIIGHLKEECPELIDGVTPKYLREMVVNGIARARTHGLRTLADLTGFVSIMFEIAPNFDEIRELRVALHDKSIPKEERFFHLFDSKFDEAWEKADNLDNDKAKDEAWFPELKDGQE